MNFELDEAIKLNKKVILAIKEGLDYARFRTHAISVIEFKTIDHLIENLHRLVRQLKREKSKVFDTRK